MILIKMEENKKLYLVGKIIHFQNKAFEFQGIFSTEELAVQQCLDETYFIGECELDEIIPHESTEWKNSYYPKYNKDFDYNSIGINKKLTTKCKNCNTLIPVYYNQIDSLNCKKDKYEKYINNISHQPFDECNKTIYLTCSCNHTEAYYCEIKYKTKDKISFFKKILNKLK